MNEIVAAEFDSLVNRFAVHVFRFAKRSTCCADHKLCLAKRSGGQRSVWTAPSGASGQRSGGLKSTMDYRLSTAQRVPSAQKNRNNLATIPVRFNRVARLGLEPRRTVPKTAVLPIRRSGNWECKYSMECKKCKAFKRFESKFDQQM